MTPKVSIIMGSTSDLKIMEAAAEFLDQMEVPYEINALSAHRVPEMVAEFAKNAHTRGVKVIIAGAGGAAHLPGVIAATTPLPVIGIPIKSSNSIDGWDSILSILQMPAGIPVATMALDGARNGGFDMLLTGNNHSYDTGESGFFRTIETVRSKGLQTLGTMLNGDEPKYAIEDINGIKVGMLSYTYQGRPDNGYANRVYLNGLLLHEGAENVVNTFIPNNPAPFYAEVESYIQQMRSEGAEALVIFLHWGVEYALTPVAHQTQIAQKLCDLGIDVIVGGHPHVVEPVALLTSNVDPEHKTVCLYSMGNAVSNQRANVMKSQPNGYTEDGVWFTMTFCKYSDGTVYLEDVNLIPTWVYLRTTNGRRYDILPLDEATQGQWAQLYDLQDVTVSAAQRSFNRTMSIVGEGLAESRQYLASAQEERDANYLAALMEQLYGNEAA